MKNGKRRTAISYLLLLKHDRESSASPLLFGPHLTASAQSASLRRTRSRREYACCQPFLLQRLSSPDKKIVAPPTLQLHGGSSRSVSDTKDKPHNTLHFSSMLHYSPHRVRIRRKMHHAPRALRCSTSHSRWRCSTLASNSRRRCSTFAWASLCNSDQMQDDESKRVSFHTIEKTSDHKKR